MALPETLDKVVASVGYDAITQSDVMEEYHFERFLQSETPTGTPSEAEQQDVLSRLISQKLLAGQMRTPARESKNGRKMAEETLNNIRKKFPSEAAYRSALQSLGMTEQQVLKRLEIYQRTLRMIDNRLRPAAQPEPSEVEGYYKKTFVPEYAKGHTGPPPPLDDVREQIREILVQEKMNQLLDNWLKRLKSDHRVTIHSY
ncbi:MAG: hypothetical protein P8Z30_00115 [Acidobacteriota bacterium]